ncbi:MAG: hypothetical protein RLZZ299_1181, partial [Pseudomonadota bacterium]
MSSPNPRRRRVPTGRTARVPRAVLGVAIAACLLGVAELAARMAGVLPAYQPERMGGWRMYAVDVDRVVRAPDGTRFRVRTNADGLRTTLARARTPGIGRLAFLGDSTAFGWGVDEGGTFADGLATRLRERGLADVEVLNAAQPGYSTVQAVRLYEEVVESYAPDLVVLFLPLHDHNRVTVSDPEWLRGGRGPLAVLRVQLATRSRLYEGLRRAVVPHADAPFLRPDQAAGLDLRVPRVSDDERDVALRALLSLVSGGGGRLALGHLPFRADMEGRGAAPRTGLAWASAWADAHGVPVVDLRGCCDGKAADYVLPHDPGHLSAAGNLAAGAAAAERLEPLIRGGGGGAPPPPPPP